MTATSSLRDEFARQHQRLETTLQSLLDSADSDNPQDLQRAWTTFEAELSTHLISEENELFPLVKPFHPEEVQALWREHERIRGLVSELGVCCDLHRVNRPTLADLVQTLRQHAEREERTLYVWAEELAPADTRRHLLGLLAKTLRADLTGPRTR